MKKDKFFKRLKRWSERKHRLLEKYLPPFSAKVGSWAREVYCIDAFAGAAVYDDGKEGSPLLMANLSDICASWKNPVTLRLINVESKKKHFESLSVAIKPWVDKGVVNNKFGKFGELVPEILQEIGHRPALFFLDPYGPTTIYFSYLEPIVKRSVSATELIINFNVRGLRRLADCLHAQEGETTDSRAISKIIAHVTRIMGSENWKQYFITDKIPTLEREEILRKEYMKNLNKYGYNVVSYPIRETIEKHPKYYLIYCSRHEEGVMLMNRFIREEEDRIFKDATQNRHPLFEATGDDEYSKIVSDRQAELRLLVGDYVREVTTSTRKSIKKHLIYKYFGQFGENDYTTIVQQLVNEGKLRTGHGKKRFNDAEPLTYVP